MALKKKKKIPAKKKKSTVKVVKTSKKTSNTKSKPSISSRTGKKKVASKTEVKKQKDTSKAKKTQLNKLTSKETDLKKQLKPSEIPKKSVKKEIKKKSKLHSVEKRKILELKKELDNLDKKSKEAVLIKDAEGRLYCHDEKCDQPAVTDMYCRYHYLALWKYLQIRKKLRENKYLVSTIQSLMKTFGTGVVSFMLYDLKSEKTFESVAKDMNFSTGKEEEVIHSDTDSNF